MPPVPLEEHRFFHVSASCCNADTCVAEIFMAQFGETIYIRNSKKGVGAGAIVD